MFFWPRWHPLWRLTNRDEVPAAAVARQYPRNLVEIEVDRTPLVGELTNWPVVARDDHPQRGDPRLLSNEIADVVAGSSPVDELASVQPLGCPHSGWRASRQHWSVI